MQATTKSKILRRFSLSSITFLAMLFGILAGRIFGGRLVFLGEFSVWVVTLIKWLSLPLIFLAILDGFLKASFQKRGFVALLFVAFFNSSFAILISLFIANVFQPGKRLSILMEPSVHFSNRLQWLENLRNHFSWNELLNLFTGTTLVIGLALFLGISLLLLKRLHSPRVVFFLSQSARATSLGLNLIFRIIDGVVLLLPAAVFCSVTKAVGSHGFSLAQGLLAYFLSCAAGMLIHILLVYQSWILWAGQFSLTHFWKIVAEPALYAFGVNSSLATVPITLKALEKLKISPSSARLSACVGTNFNNDGILLYEVVAALFIIQSYGIELGLSGQLMIALIAVIACIGVAGIPEAGIISLSLVLTSIGLPTEALTFLLTIDWVLARMRSFTNVLGDITVAVALDRLASPGRFSKSAKLP